MRKEKFKQFYTAKEVCKKLKISRATLARYMTERGLNYVKIGRTVRFAEDDLIDFITPKVTHNSSHLEANN